MACFMVGSLGLKSMFHGEDRWHLKVCFMVTNFKSVFHSGICWHLIEFSLV